MDTASGFHFYVRADVLFKECYVFYSSTFRAKAGGCFDEVGAAFCDDFTSLYFFIFCEITGLYDDFEDMVPDGFFTSRMSSST